MTRSARAALYGLIAYGASVAAAGLVGGIFGGMGGLLGAITFTAVCGLIAFLFYIVSVTEF